MKYDRGMYLFTYEYILSFSSARSEENYIFATLVTKSNYVLPKNMCVERV